MAQDNQHDKDLSAYLRKDAHLDLAKQLELTAQITHPFDNVRLLHHALPGLNLSDITLHTSFCGKSVSSPLFIGAMTGGTPRATAINHALAEVAADKNIALALGSQRAGLAKGLSQKALRTAHPQLVLIGNLGITQLASETGFDMAMRAIDDIEATAMAIHLNPLQEAAQIEGDHNWKGTADALASFIAKSPVPVIVKEVGAGITPALAEQLIAMGASYVDVAGLGGTNWTRIEVARHDDDDATATETQDRFAPFLDWGIDTKTALSEARHALPYAKLIASGGMRHGLDVAKSLALGADMVCAAGPFLRAVEPQADTISTQNLSDYIDSWHEQLKLACFLTNSKKFTGLRGKIAI